MSKLLNDQLADIDAQTVTLSRDDALLALGLVDGVGALMRREIAGEILSHFHDRPNT